MQYIVLWMTSAVFSDKPRGMIIQKWISHDHCWCKCVMDVLYTCKQNNFFHLVSIFIFKKNSSIPTTSKDIYPRSKLYSNFETLQLQSEFP